jgi:acetamidase/formamidase
MDNTKKFKDQKIIGHNRWHPDIPPAVSIKPGEVFRADVREWFDGAIRTMTQQMTFGMPRFQGCTFSQGRSTSRAPSLATC